MSVRDSTKHCTFPGCQKSRLSRLHCPGHHYQLKRGLPLKPLYEYRRPNGSPPRIRYTEAACSTPGVKGPCHIFDGGTNDDGYGQVRLGPGMVKVHRYVWEQRKGPIPKGLEIDHRCRVRKCCNVLHLRVVSGRVNSIENSNGVGAINAAKTHCVRGHAFDSINTRIDALGRRVCRMCRREWFRRYRARKRQERLLLLGRGGVA